MYRHQFTLRSFTLVVFETLLILSAVAVAAYAVLGEWVWVIFVKETGLTKTLIVAGVTQVCLYYADLYDLKRLADRRELFLRVTQALGAAALILSVVYYWLPTMVIGRGVFGIAAVPAVFAVLVIILGVKEPSVHKAAGPRRVSWAEVTRFPRRYWSVVVISMLMTLARFSEGFLLLRAQSLGMQDALVPLVLIVMNVVYAGSSYPVGKLSDRIGKRG